MARTNKKGIAAKKAQLHKQASRTKGERKMTYPKRKLSTEQAKEIGVIGVKTNPKGHEFTRFLKGRKLCRDTRLSIDSDGYRLVKLPSGGLDFVEVPISGWLRKKLAKCARLS